MENLGDLRREGTGGGELFANEIAGGDVRDTEEVREARGVANEIAGGDVRDTEEVREARGVGAFSDAGASQGKPTKQGGGHGGEGGTFGQGPVGGYLLWLIFGGLESGRLTVVHGY
uniref:Uncharacterized protein n=1 Tax=Fagus sylvatica TaxID=28930 RepID=A0A2N9G2H4_FAGSY